MYIIRIQVVSIFTLYITIIIHFFQLELLTGNVHSFTMVIESSINSLN